MVKIVQFPLSSNKGEKEKVFTCYSIIAYADEDFAEDLICDCQTFFILVDGYECASCGQYHSFEDVHGSIDY